MRKIFTLFLTLLISMGTISAASGTCGDNLTWDLTNGVLTISGSGNMTNWSRYSDVPWYSYWRSIRSVTIGNSVTSIGDWAFYNYSNLTSVTIGNSITSIGDRAFYGCKGLTSVTIPNSVTSIEANAFYDCSGLTSVTIGNSVTSIGSYAFYRCKGLTSITIPNSVTRIGDNAFLYCSGLTSITLPNSITSIESFAFSGCKGLTSITIPNSVTSIGSYAFSSCTGLTSIEIPNSVTSIGDHAFSSCYGITSFVVENGNAVYDSRDNCNAIIQTSTHTLIVGCKNTIIPTSITSIGDHAFFGCSKMTSIAIPNSVTSIGEKAFSSCSGLTSITCNAVVPPTCGADAFYNVKKSIPVYVPEESIEAYQTADVWSEFANIKATERLLASGTCGENLIWELSYDNVLTISGSGGMTYWSNYSDVPWYSYRGNIRSVIIGNSVTSIGEKAFYFCSGLTNVTISNSVTRIGNYAFYYCSGLTSVTIGNSVTSIGSKVFSGCSRLTSIEIPNSVTSIGDYVFADCSSLTSVTIGNSVTNIGNYSFNYCSSLTSIVVENGNIVYDSRDNCNAIIETSTHTLIVGCKNTIIPNSVTSIGDYAFFGCSNMTSIAIPNSVTRIGNDAFVWCSSMTSITIGNSVISIGKYAFNLCKGLTSVTIPNSVTSIGDHAFFGCSGLTSVTMGNSVTSIGDYAFADCSGLTSITCNAVVPPTCGADAFYEVNKSIPLYVPVASMGAYKVVNEWKDFTNIQPIQAADVNVTGVVVEPTDNSVAIQWPIVSGATSYELVIRDKDGNIICTLIFNAQGQLLSIAFHAPSRNDAPQQTQTAGFSFTVTGLEAGTSYDLTLTAKNASGGTLQTKTISFVTNGAEGIEEILANPATNSRKVLIDGQVLIRNNDKLFNLQGQEVK